MILLPQIATYMALEIFLAWITTATSLTPFAAAQPIRSHPAAPAADLGPDIAFQFAAG